MAVVVENAMDQVEAYTKGNGVFPVSPEIAADNAKQQEKASGSDKTSAKAGETPANEPKGEETAAKGTASSNADDDTEGEDGLTPRQKREFTKAMQATIGKKHRLQREAEEFAQQQYQEAKLAEARAAKLEADMAALKAQLTPAKAEETLKEPTRDSFKTDQEYWDAMVDYRVERKLRVQQAEAEKQAIERFAQEEQASAASKLERAAELVEDFQEVFESADVSLPNYVMDAIKGSDLMPELVYHLGKNREEAEKIADMTKGLRPGSPQFVKAAQRQLVAIGKIESKLSPFASAKANADPASQETAVAETKETGSAPSKPRVNAPIIQPLNGGSASQVERDEANLTGSQVITRWQKKHGVNLTARKRH